MWFGHCEVSSPMCRWCYPKSPHATTHTLNHRMLLTCHLSPHDAMCRCLWSMIRPETAQQTRCKRNRWTYYCSAPTARCATLHRHMGMKTTTWRERTMPHDPHDNSRWTTYMLTFWRGAHRGSLHNSHNILFMHAYATLTAALASLRPVRPPKATLMAALASPRPVCPPNAHGPRPVWQARCRRRREGGRSPRVGRWLRGNAACPRGGRAGYARAAAATAAGGRMGRRRIAGVTQRGALILKWSEVKLWCCTMAPLGTHRLRL